MMTVSFEQLAAVFQVYYTVVNKAVSPYVYLDHVSVMQTLNAPLHSKQTIKLINTFKH